jgi:nucleotide-binding universal stress UspA family protein
MKEFNIKRILVALDASQQSASALRAALDIADRLGAELEGLFVEDADVRRLAEMSFTREIGFFSGKRRRLDVQRLTVQLRAQAGRMERYFDFISRQTGVKCRFRVVRGEVAREILTAAADADVVILGKDAWSAVETGEVGPVVREVLNRLGTSALVLQAPARLDLPMLAVYDGSELAEKALAAAVALTREEEEHLTVLLLADEQGACEDLRAQVDDLLPDKGLEVSYEMLTESRISRLVQLLSYGQFGAIALPARSVVMQDEAVLDFLDQVNIPVLLVQENE